ncbi:acyl-CoA dehydrogenase [Mycolicibacterium flavescens]|uniref:acyl-CoA dehydrogenase family protein n=1 Tax=Mycobacterium neumannii TaxID=2048551 RepID=UPI000B93F076|nr:acyl-CoA dehydrogenase [Mycobacterium neumannii]VEG46428.1 acyl-CoA dehydrogenase [Mycolicibacterium flavescens]
MGTEGDAALDDAADIELVRGAARDFLAECGTHDSLKDLAAMDWTGLLVNEDLGGSGWRPVETTVIAEELGRSGNSTHWLGSVTAAGALSSAPPQIRDQWLPAMLDGTGAAACALAADVTRVSGAESVDIIVTFGGNGIHLFEAANTLPREADEEMLDVNRPVWRVDLSGAQSVPIGGPERAEQLLALARILLSADSLGALSATFDRLVTYLKDRIAFGAPIASFQAVQHRLAELSVFEAKARAVLTKAARALSSDTTTSDAVTLSVAAHSFIAANATAAVDECMQLSGGIGFTWEYPLHHELRRVFTNACLLGTARSSRALFADRVGW